MITLTVRNNFPEVQRKLEALSQNVRDRVIPAALNKVADKARTEMKRRIAAEFNIKQGDVNSQLEVSKASRKLGIFEVRLQPFGRRRGHISRNVMLFKAMPTKPTSYKTVRAQIHGKWVTMKVPVGGGVSVEIRRGQRKTIEGAFIANKGRTVFIRTGKDRLPIKGVETVDVPSMFNKRTINAAVMRKIETDLPVEFDRAIKLAIDKGWR